MIAGTMPAASTDTIRHVRVRANGIEFHVALAGPDDAPLVLCLHGFPECWYSWRHQLEGLSDRFLVAAPDLRGYGETEKPASGYELVNLAADVAALVPALGRSSASVVGHDWGGFLAYAAAARHPAAVERLAVLNCPHPAAITAAFPTLDQLRRSWYIFAMQVPGLFDWRLARDGAAILPRVFKSGARRRDAFTAADLEVLRASFARPGVIPAALRYYRTNLSPLALLRGRMRTPPVPVPTLVLYGRDDPFEGPHLFHGHERHFTGPYEIRYIPDCGHWTQQEVPDLVNEALATFFRR
jgi:pimeloyl-ACP methyl ester carboxylesterase